MKEKHPWGEPFETSSFANFNYSFGEFFTILCVSFTFSLEKNRYALQAVKM